MSERPHPPPHPPPGHRSGVATGELLYLSAVLLSTLWAAVLLFTVYPQSPVDAGYADDDVPVMSLQGNVVTVKRAELEEALASRRYVPASPEQVDYFEARRAATVKAVKRDKLFWYVAAAAFPGVALFLLRVWYRAQRRA
jgi:hypothetical protein